MSVRIRIRRVGVTSVVLALAAAAAVSGCSGPTVPSVFGSSSESRSSPPASEQTTSEGGAVGGAGVPPFNSDCLGVASAYANVGLAMLPALTGGGNGTFDAGGLTGAIGGLGGRIPADLQAEFQVLGEGAKAAQGRSLADAGTILGSDKVTRASDAIGDWMDDNCGG